MILLSWMEWCFFLWIDWNKWHIRIDVIRWIWYVSAYTQVHILQDSQTYSTNSASSPVRISLKSQTRGSWWCVFQWQMAVVDQHGHMVMIPGFFSDVPDHFPPKPWQFHGCPYESYSYPWWSQVPHSTGSPIWIAGNCSKRPRVKHTRWCPPVISWFINPINYRYNTYKP